VPNFLNYTEDGGSKLYWKVGVYQKIPRFAGKDLLVVTVFSN
jgi:hypothetical protein